MKPFVRSMSMTAALLVVTTGLIAGQSNAAPSEQWYRAKFGRPSPTEEARLKAERASSAFREEAPPRVAPAAPNWTEQYFKAKYGRSTPAEEARLKAERESSAFREEPGRGTAPARSWFEQWYKMKFGRTPGR